MQPKRIILVRHAESEANVNKALYETVPEQSFRLTEKGEQQAVQAGKSLKAIIGDEKICAYISPYQRTRQTFEHIHTEIAQNIDSSYEDPRIREQEWGHFQSPQDLVTQNRARLKYGVFYYRVKDGESPADVYTRVAAFNETLYRDFQADDYAENCLIVSHGMTIRVFLMAWLREDVAYFDSLKNPKNGQIIVLERQENGQYLVTSELERRK